MNLTQDCKVWKGKIALHKLRNGCKLLTGEDKKSACFLDQSVCSPDIQQIKRYLVTSKTHLNF